MDPDFVPKAPIDVPPTPSKIHPYAQKLLMPFLAILTLLVGLGASVYLTRQRQLIAPKASSNLVDLSLSSPTTVNPDQNFSVTIGVDPHDYKVTAVELKLTVSPNLEIVSLTPGTYLSSVLVAPTISAQGSVVNTTLASGTTPAQSAGLLATVVVKAKTNSTGAATINVDPSSAVAGIDSNGTAVPTTLLGDVGQANITISNVDLGPTPTPTTGQPNSCGGTCGSNSNCANGLFCYQGYCRNYLCASANNCVCTTSTPTPNTTPVTTSAPTYPTPTPEVVSFTGAVTAQNDVYVPTATPTLPDLDTLMEPTAQPVKLTFWQRFLNFFLNLFGIKY